jgi:hypothetical protein
MNIMGKETRDEAIEKALKKILRKLLQTKSLDCKLSRGELDRLIQAASDALTHD